MPLTVGDHCPDLAFNNIINFKTERAKLSDFKGKLVILDFWATWCGSCIVGMPKLDSLQKKYQDKIVVLPITYQEKEQVAHFFKTQSIGKTVYLPSVVEDTTLKKLFPYLYLPHQVWIDGNGKVIAITKGGDATDANIELAFEGKLSLRKKKDVYTDTDKPIFFGRFGNDYKFNLDQVKYQSTIMDYIPNIGGAYGPFQVIGDKIFVSYTNVVIEGLYAYGFAESTKRMYKKPEFSFASAARIIVEVKDSSMFPYRDKTRPKRLLTTEELFGKVFSFEMVLPVEDSVNLKKYMVEDLNRYFGRRYGINGMLEKRDVKCWVLKRTTKNDLLKTKGGKYDFQWNEHQDSLKITNSPLREMVFWFTTRFFTREPHPFIDETGYEGNIDLNIVVDLKDPLKVSDALNKYGLEIVLEKRNIDMVVIKNIK